MLLHIVLFRPRADIDESDRVAMFESLRLASRGIPSIMRFEIGRRVIHGAAYEKWTSADYPYAAVIEFEDLQALNAYLGHPLHERLSELFYSLMEAALVCDYEVERIEG